MPLGPTILSTSSTTEGTKASSEKQVELIDGATHRKINALGKMWIEHLNVRIELE